jgi:hypothetical protein
MQQRVSSQRTLLLAVGLTALLVLPALVLYAQTSGSNLSVYRVNRQSQWQEWTFPVGTLEFAPNGSVTPVEFKGTHNAALNAKDFTHALVSGKEIQGGAWKAGSNFAAADNIIDGDSQTFWQPDANAPLDEWWIEIDLGRATLVSEIRLIFPDQEGARPFSEFRVFGTEGRRVTRSDIFSFHLIGGTTKPINETLVTYDVQSLVREVKRTRELGNGEEAAAVIAETYDMLQYIRILVDAKTPDAAIAEVEVYTPGENIALQTLARGGTIQERAGRGFAFKMADGDANTDWGARRERGQDPIAWDWDLGALFWVDRIVLRTSDFLLRTLTYGSNLPQIRTHSLSISAGERTLTGAVDFDELFVGDTAALLSTSSEFPGQLTYLFAPQPVRFVAAEWVGGGGNGSTASSFEFQSGFLVETQIFPVGHVAQVEMNSDFIDLGQIAGDDRAKVIKSLDWQADLPPGARIQARTRSGNELQEIFSYFRKDGTQVTDEQYEQMAKVLRGEVTSMIGIGEDWSEWSNFYQRPGEQFLSPSPRRFVQIQLILSSDRPSTAPTLRSLELEFTDAFLAGVEGEVLPRTAEPGVMQLFSFRIVPVLGTRDSGFNRILLQTPTPVDPADLTLKIDGTNTTPATVLVAGDSLLVELPRTIRREQVEVAFNTVLSNNATVFKAFVGQTTQPEIWQPVDPLQRAATTVYLPGVPGSGQLIANLSVQPFVSPNGDGIGDAAQIRFNVLKVDAPPEVQIYTLDGRLVNTLKGQLQTDQSHLYSWSAQDRDGTIVPPGSYLCRIGVDAQAGAKYLLRVISVAY